jgi:hypothetical protein
LAQSGHFTAECPSKEKTMAKKDKGSKKATKLAKKVKEDAKKETKNRTSR